MISSIVLAAGMSTRMGEPKALLDWGGEPLVAYQVHQLRDAGVDEVIVVVGHKADEVHRKIGHLPCRVMLNPRYQMGRAGSLRIAAKAVDRDADTIVIVNVDQPCPAASIRRLIEAHDGSTVTQPSFDGHRGHPVIVAGSLRGELLTVTDEDGGLRGLLQRHQGEIRDVPGDAVNALDLDTPEDYAAARATFGLPA